MNPVLRIFAFAMAVCLACMPAQAREGTDWYVAASESISLLKDSHTQILNLPIPAGHAEVANRTSTGPGVQVALGMSHNIDFGVRVSF